MNVKISITVPVEDVPIKISEFIENNVSLINRYSHQLSLISEKIKNNYDMLSNLSELDDIRKKIFIIDSSLEDCYSILKGYVNYEYKLQPQEEKRVENNVTSDQGSSS